MYTKLIIKGKEMLSICPLEVINILWYNLTYVCIKVPIVQWIERFRPKE